MFQKRKALASLFKSLKEFGKYICIVHNLSLILCNASERDYSFLRYCFNFFSVYVGVSYRKGIEYSEDIRIAGFLLPSIHIESLPYVEFV